MSRRRYRQCTGLTLLAGALLSIASGCSDSDPQGFCETAAEVFNDGELSSDGIGVVAELRTIDLTDIAAADRQRFLDAIAEVESAIAAHRSGSSYDGWTTKPVANIAAKLCDREMRNLVVMP